MPNNLDNLFSALSDPTRRAVVQRLTNGPASVTDLASPHDMALPSFTQHIKVLEQSGLISTTKKGRVRMVNLEAQQLTKIQKWLEQQRMVWEARFDRIETLVMSTEDDTS